MNATGEGAPPNRELRILVADDSATTRLLTRRMLVRLGHSAEEVPDGSAALNAATSSVYDAILMDIQMPRLDGITATRLIRALPFPFGVTPIIGTSGNASLSSERACREAGMDAFIAKPFGITGLAEAIATAISEDAAAGGSPILDETMLACLCEDIGPDGAEEAAALFLGQVQARSERIQAAANSPSSLRREAHALSSTARALGLVRLAETAVRVETGPATALGPGAHLLLKLLRHSGDRLAQWRAPRKSA